MESAIWRELRSDAECALVFALRCRRVRYAIEPVRTVPPSCGGVCQFGLVWS